MAEYKIQKFETKAGISISIRSAEEKDANGILALASSVIAEEVYQLTSAAEFNMTVEAEEKWVDSHRNNPSHLILIAERGLEIVGMIDFSNGHRHRIAHTGEFGMSVAKSMRDQGVGRLLLESLMDWASKNETIEKIGLSVHANNERAIALYKKMGFDVEGIRKRDLKYGENNYVDTLIMGKFVE